ncbi:Lrp/AsnC family transcriptional regulator [Pseudoalteromonas piscicida]|uniref:Lrp/AsnC family transcriptional regulator n=1 Tax=Pseudoalteromonas piscicida TaxID=43662 RepID=A0AAQ2EQ29_PSEO7|nr:MULTISPECIES: Lrp/AsnC family transcriptional regulator [Pseudoalteromonas]KJY92674.1 AsnC family transcriptional regulator [Pseudoalteromonas piscicida]MDP4487306.1 Lrp/AsnC family transcriptional regulator [Pseudoalteromonas piscicida]TMN34594.1 Lrp/AsnC family transcriptional regulator [Pseudoalteromonas piscicida]TMN36293.1 Lrp/AsnC family transcriptional regulator [Pseudoalteromonas piscicida]TMN47156.1 Lrp/AsnC family transcriptional regulator [Pseudoalteromonas piscicida]
MRKLINNEKWSLDAIDSKLIALLENNSRVSVAEMARAVNMSSPSVNERMKRMEEYGVIHKYSIELDPESFDYPLTAIVRIRQHPGKLKQLETMIQSIPEVIECDKVTGEDCFYVRLCFESMPKLDEILDKVSTLGDTHTSVVKSTIVKRRNVPYQIRKR